MRLLHTHPHLGLLGNSCAFGAEAKADFPYSVVYNKNSVFLTPKLSQMNNLKGFIEFESCPARRRIAFATLTLINGTCLRSNNEMFAPLGICNEGCMHSSDFGIASSQTSGTECKVDIRKWKLVTSLLPGTNPIDHVQHTEHVSQRSRDPKFVTWKQARVTLNERNSLSTRPAIRREVTVWAPV